MLVRSLKKGAPASGLMVDQRGKIKTGMKIPTKDSTPENPKMRPVGLDYFNVDKFPELVEAYGEKPKAIVVRFPTSNIPELLDEGYKTYRGGDKGKPTKARSCDGQTCIHHIDDSMTFKSGDQVVTKTYKAGEAGPCHCIDIDETIDPDNKKKCRYRAYLKAFVSNPQTGKIMSPLCYLFETGSENSGNAIRSCLATMLPLMKGNIAMLPFMLGVKMVAGKKAMEKFPIWTLTPIGTMEQLNDMKKKLEAFISPVAMLEAPVPHTPETVDEKEFDLPDFDFEGEVEP